MNNLKYRVDIVFCIDLSDHSLLSIFKKGITSLTDMKNEFLSKEKIVEVFRVKFVLFDNDIENLQESPFFILPGMEDELDAFIVNLNSKKDNMQNSVIGLTAIECAIKSKWTNKGEINRHIIITYSPNTSREVEKMKILSDLWESEQLLKNRSKRLILFAPDSHDWRNIAKHWDNTVHFPSKSGEGISEIDYGTILMSVTNSI